MSQAGASPNLTGIDAPVAPALPSGTLQLVALAIGHLWSCLAIVWAPKLDNADLPVTLLADEFVDLVVQVSKPVQTSSSSFLAEQ